MFGRTLAASLRPARIPATASHPRTVRARKPEVEGLEHRRVLDSASASSGLYAVTVWTEPYHGNQNDNDVFASLYHYENGHWATRAARIPVATSGRNETQPSVAINANGQFAVSYTERVGGTDTDVMVRMYNNIGTTFRPAIRVDSSTKAESDSHVSISPNGMYVAVAYTQQYSASDRDVLAARLRYDSIEQMFVSAGRSTIANTGRNESDAHPLIVNNGNFAVSYTYQYSTTDNDIKGAIVRGNTVTRFDVTTSGANETNSNVESYDGNHSVTISWWAGGLKRARTQYVV